MTPPTPPSELRCARCGHRNPYHPIEHDGATYNDSSRLTTKFDRDGNMLECGCPAFVPPEPPA